MSGYEVAGNFRSQIRVGICFGENRPQMSHDLY
jgi:hypothetical protein